MKDELVCLTCEIELQPGEPLRLPEALAAAIGPGRWRLTVQAVRRPPVRSHSAFLNSYAPEDEGLYDAYPAR
jgi:ferredoxin